MNCRNCCDDDCPHAGTDGRPHDDDCYIPERPDEDAPPMPDEVVDCISGLVDVARDLQRRVEQLEHWQANVTRAANGYSNGTDMP